MGNGSQPSLATNPRKKAPYLVRHMRILHPSQQGVARKSEVSCCEEQYRGAGYLALPEQRDFLVEGDEVFVSDKCWK